MPKLRQAAGESVIRALAVGAGVIAIAIVAFSASSGLGVRTDTEIISFIVVVDYTDSHIQATRERGVVSVSDVSGVLKFAPENAGVSLMSHLMKLGGLVFGFRGDAYFGSINGIKGNRLIVT